MAVPHTCKTAQFFMISFNGAPGSVHMGTATSHVSLMFPSTSEPPCSPFASRKVGRATCPREVSFRDALCPGRSASSPRPAPATWKYDYVEPVGELSPVPKWLKLFAGRVFSCPHPLSPAHCRGVLGSDRPCNSHMSKFSARTLRHCLGFSWRIKNERPQPSEQQLCSGSSPLLSP